MDEVDMVGDGQLLDAFPTVDVAKDGALHGRQHHVTIQPTPHVLHQRRRTRRTRSVRHDNLHTKPFKPKSTAYLPSGFRLTGFV